MNDRPPHTQGGFADILAAWAHNWITRWRSRSTKGSRRKALSNYAKLVEADRAQNSHGDDTKDQS